jgi:hypothetical protein
LIWLLTAAIGNLGEPGSIDSFNSFHGWQRAGMVAAMTKQTAAMVAREICQA